MVPVGEEGILEEAAEKMDHLLIQMMDQKVVSIEVILVVVLTRLLPGEIFIIENMFPYVIEIIIENATIVVAHQLDRYHQKLKVGILAEVANSAAEAPHHQIH